MMATSEGPEFAPIGRSNTAGSALARVFTAGSKASKKRTDETRYSDQEKEDASDPISSDWSLMSELQAMQQGGEKEKGQKLGVTWTNLTVKGIGADSAFNENVGSQFNMPQLIKESRQPPPLKYVHTFISTPI
jgi:hypothetical protein